MYCTNCGKEMDPNAAVCINCGYAAGTGDKYCKNCGHEMTPGQAFCTQCGYATQPQEVKINPDMQKSKIAAGLLGIFLGTFGVHNFYLGYTGKALAQLLITVLSCGILAVASSIWGLIEGIMILTGNINKDARGIPLKD